jgi:hypothetical protein
VSLSRVNAAIYLYIYDERVLSKLEMGNPMDVFIPLIEKDLHLLLHFIAAF